MKNSSLLKWGGVVIGVVALVLVWRFLPAGEWIKSLISWIEGQGWVGYLIFGAIYVVGTILFFPGSPFTVAAGITFGMAKGIALALVSATIGACFAFLIGRYLARGMVERWIAGNERFRALDSAIGKEGWKIIGLLRLSPVIPFNVSNYVFGLTKVRFWPYALATLGGMLPGTFVYVYLGHIGKAALAGGRDRTTEENLFLAIGLVATIGVTWYLARLARRTLRRETGVEES